RALRDVLVGVANRLDQLRTAAALRDPPRRRPHAARLLALEQRKARRPLLVVREREQQRRGRDRGRRPRDGAVAQEESPGRRGEVAAAELKPELELRANEIVRDPWERNRNDREECRKHRSAEGCATPSTDCERDADEENDGGGDGIEPTIPTGRPGEVDELDR